MSTNLKDVARIDALERDVGGLAGTIMELRYHIVQLKHRLEAAEAELKRRKGGRPRKDQNVEGRYRGAEGRP